jgi:predicted  nucleic acid-binding Zn-ribbon protein
MGALDDAAEELVKKLMPFTQQLGEVKDRFDELDDDLKQMREKIDGEWDALSAKAREFIGKVQEEQGALGRKCDEAGRALADLKTRTATGRGELQAETDDLQGQIRALQQAIDPLDADVESHVANQSEAVMEALAATAGEVIGEIDLELADVKQFLEQSVVQAFESMHLVIDTWAKGLVKAAEEGEARLDRAYQEWAVKLAEVGDSVGKQLFKAAQQNADKTVEHALAECRTAHEEKLQDTAEAVEALAGLLGELKTAIDGAENTVESGAKKLDKGMDEMKDAILDAQKDLDKMEKFLAKYTFAQG